MRRLRFKQLLNISFEDVLFKAVARLWESINLELVTHSACAHSQLLLLLILIIRSSTDSFFLFSCSTQIFAAVLRKESRGVVSLNNPQRDENNNSTTSGERRAERRVDMRADSNPRAELEVAVLNEVVRGVIRKLVLRPCGLESKL